MCEISEIQDYLQKWLEAERDLVINGGGLQSYPYNYEPIDNIDKDIPIELGINKDRQ
jgi:hypothetical protein